MTTVSTASSGATRAKSLMPIFEASTGTTTRRARPSTAALSWASLWSATVMPSPVRPVAPMKAVLTVKRARFSTASAPATAPADGRSTPPSSVCRTVGFSARAAATAMPLVSALTLRAVSSSAMRRVVVPLSR